MTSITLNVTGARIRAAVNGPLTSGMVGIPVTIRYDDSWNGLTKNLVCRCGKWGPDKGNTRTVLNIGETTTVAHEVMQADMHLYLGIEGYSTNGKLVIPTTWADCGKIQHGANAGADPSTNPKLPVWAQMQAEIKQIKQNSVTEGEITAAVAAYLEENPIESSAVKSVNGIAPDADGNVEITISNSIGSANQTASGWSTEEILILETILKNCVTQSDQTNNINALITLLKSNSSGSEGSGGSGGDSGEDSGDSGNETYSVVLNLTGVTASNGASSVESGSVYINQLSVGEGYELGTPAISMNGNDVTSQYYSGDGVISIPNVQGDIVISCKALAVETLTFVGGGSTFPNTTTFETGYGTGLSHNNATNVSTTVGGKIRVDWDTERITGSFRLHIFLYKDGQPYKFSSIETGDETVETDGNVAATYYWVEPGNIASSTRMIVATAPCEVIIPDGCTCYVLVRKGDDAAFDGAALTNAGFGSFISAGNITVTMTEAG